jgi:hypothetical protein
MYSASTAMCPFVSGINGLDVAIRIIDDFGNFDTSLVVDSLRKRTVTPISLRAFWGLQIGKYS